MQTQIRLLLQEQSDQGLHCFCSIIKFLTHHRTVKSFAAKFRTPAVDGKTVLVFTENIVAYYIFFSKFEISHKSNLNLDSLNFRYLTTLFLMSQLLNS